jgi:hypothetical protein
MRCIIRSRRHSVDRLAPVYRSLWKLMVSQNFVTLASRLEQPRVLMSFAWTISFAMQCFIVLVWIRNCFLDRRNSGPKRHWHMDGININIRSNPSPSIMISCYQLHNCLFLGTHCLILPCLIFSPSRISCCQSW